MSALTIVGLDNVLSSIPAMLTFVPTESVVFLPLMPKPGGGQTLGPVARVDLTVVTAMPDTVARQLARVFSVLSVTSLIAAVITTVNEPADDLPYRSEVAAISKALSENGLPEPEALFVPSMTTGTQWTCYQHPGHTGVLPDPATTALAASAVVAGESIKASRDDLARRFTPGPGSDRERLRPLVATAASTIAFDDGADDRPELRARLMSMDRAVSDVGEGRYPDRDIVVAELIAAFGTPALRDAMLITRTREDTVALEDLALYLWKLAEEPYASHLAAVVAASAYRRGDGAGAATALDAATGSFRLAQLISAVLQRGLRPSKIDDMFGQAAHTARTELGIPNQP
jgi:uncharacterized protein DUF4192